MKLLPSCNPLDEQLLYQSDNQSIVASLISLCSQMQKNIQRILKEKLWQFLLLLLLPQFPQKFSKHEDGVIHVLVTGGAGYIGSHAALRLLEEGHRVTIVVCTTTTETPSLSFLLLIYIQQYPIPC
jgi:hypothetical protein